MLQVQLRVESRRCLVVGGGTVGTRRAKALLDAGAIVVVVDPTPSATLETLAAGSDAAESVPASGNLSGRLELLRRNFADSDMTEPDGLILVVAATNDPATNAAVGAAARRAGVLVNRADDVGSGDLAFPALARRGPVSIGVSTHGATSGSGEVNAGPVPVLARWVAQRLDEGVDELLGLDAAALTLLAELLAEARAEVRAEVHGEVRERVRSQGTQEANSPESSTRTGLDWHSAFDGSILELVQQGRRVEAKERILACL